jgi:hypothetical protein
MGVDGMYLDCPSSGVEWLAGLQYAAKRAAQRNGVRATSYLPGNWRVSPFPVTILIICDRARKARSAGEGKL